LNVLNFSSELSGASDSVEVVDSLVDFVGSLFYEIPIYNALVDATNQINYKFTIFESLGVVELFDA
jgi:hypothetical protein